MEQIVYCEVLIFLALLSADDIREQKISVRKAGVGAVIAIISRIIMGRFLCMEIIFACLPGLFLLLLSVLTRESIGKGDGVIVVILGLWTDIWWVLVVLCLAIWMVGIFALVRLLGKRKGPISFVPFLLFGMEVLMLYA